MLHSFLEDKTDGSDSSLYLQGKEWVLLRAVNVALQEGRADVSLCVRARGSQQARPGHCPLRHPGSLLNQTPPSCAHFSNDLLITDPKIRLLAADGVNALEAPLQIVASLLQVTRVVSMLTLIDI